MRLNRKSVWIGRVISGLSSAIVLAAAFMKLKGGDALTQGMTHLGVPESMITPLAVLETVCVAIYAIPKTAMLGAILLSGYMGGAICAHWRVGDPIFIQVGLGIAVWLGLWLRDPRLRALLPMRAR